MVHLQVAAASVAYEMPAKGMEAEWKALTFVRLHMWKEALDVTVVEPSKHKEAYGRVMREVVMRGATYELRNAQDFFSEPILGGTFDGEPLKLPMNGLSTASPTGQLRTPPTTCPTFNVFVLLSHAKKDH